MNKTILIVEDEALIAMLLKIMLEKEGYQICGSFAKGEEAVEFVKTSSPALILMDINLAGTINGIETARSIKTISDIPLIFMSGYHISDYQEEIDKIKPITYLTKPIRFADLKPYLEQVFNE